MKYAKVSGNNVVIKLPIDMLVVAFNNNPNNYDEEIKVKYKRKFAEGFAEHVNEHSSNAETGLTVFQEWIDQIAKLSDGSIYEKQDDIYIHQTTGYCEDNYSGTIIKPITGTTALVIGYEC